MPDRDLQPVVLSVANGEAAGAGLVIVDVESFRHVCQNRASLLPLPTR